MNITTYVYCPITHDACPIPHVALHISLHVMQICYMLSMKIISFQICYNFNLTFKYANEILYSLFFNNCKKRFKSAKL
jgi:hypothetical protein